MIQSNPILKPYLTPHSYRSYESIIRKSSNIEKHLTVINETLNNLQNNIPLISRIESDLLIAALSDFCENIYSCMDYLSQVIRHEFRKVKRGVELADGFNKMLSEVEKGKKEIYRDEVVKNMILPASSWYRGVHTIRTEETHYGMGEVFFDRGIFKYRNQNRNGNPSQIIFEFQNANDIYESFVVYIKLVERSLIKLSQNFS